MRLRFVCRNRKSKIANRKYLGCHDLDRIVNIVHEEVLAPLGAILGVMTKQHVIEAETQQFLRGQQRHAGLFRRAVALSLIAFDTRGHKVLRRAFAALCTREDMIERKFLGVFMLAAILTAISIANIDPSPFHRGFAIITTNVNIMTQTHNRRNGKNGRGRSENIIAVVFLDKYCSAKPQTDRARDADGTKRLVRKVQKQYSSS